MYTINFHIKTFDLDFLKKTENYLLSLFSFFHLSQVKHKIHPKKCKKITVLRSPHIDKKSREQFQRLTFKKTLCVSINDKNTLLIIFEILKHFKALGVEIEIVLGFLTY